MKYENQRPDLADQIKALVQSANSVKTVPHGIKTVNPGEGLQLLSSDGAEIFWDWETAAEYDTRISEGREAIDQAQAELAQTRIDLDAAAGRIDAGEAQIVQAVETANTAQELVTTTAGNLTALETTVGGFDDAIAASEQKAADALAKSVQAQVSADGKNRITRATGPASQPGTAVGDTHFTMSSMGGGGVVTRQQRWDGAAWQDEALSHQVLASLDLGKATVGELDGGRIKAGSILSDRVVVSAGENLIPDPTFLSTAMNSSRTTGTAWRIGTAANGSKVLTTNSTTQSDVPLTGAPDGWMQVDSTAKYQLQMLAGGPDQLSTYLMLLFVDGTSKSDGFQWVRGLTGSLAPKTVEWDIAALGGPVAVRPMIRRNPTPAGATNYYQQVGAVSFRRKVGTVLIEDGAITGEKVEAQSVAGAVGRFLTVEAMTGVFTESLTATDATLLGKTVAKALTVEKLTGRDAILTGTVDVAQLNVTGAMSAEIVRAMDTTTKRLIVTEDAILNRATVVESLVTPELISEKANIGDLAARMITSGMLQTSTAANRGVKIDSSGINAWNDTGTQTIRLNGKNNLLTGDYTSSEDPWKARVSIRTQDQSLAALDLYGGRNPAYSDHLGIWHYDLVGDDGRYYPVSRVLSQNGPTRVRNDPGMIMWPADQAFGFNGYWSSTSEATQFGWLYNSNGLTGGQYVDWTYTYDRPFPTTHVAGRSIWRCPMVSVESEKKAEIVAVITEETASRISIRLVNKSSNDSGAFKVRIATFNTVGHNPVNNPY